MAPQRPRSWHGPLCLALAFTALAFVSSGHAHETASPINYTYRITTEQFTPGSPTPIATNTITTTTKQIESSAAKLADEEINDAAMTGSIGLLPEPGTTKITYKTTISRYAPASVTPNATRTITTTTPVLENIGALIANYAVTQLTVSPGQAASTRRADTTTASIGSKINDATPSGSARAIEDHRHSEAPNYTYQITTAQFAPGATTPIATNTITTTTNQIETAAAKLANKEMNDVVTTGSIGTLPTSGTTNYTYKVTISRFVPGSKTPDATHMINTNTNELQNIGALVANYGVGQLTPPAGPAASALRTGKTTASVGSKANIATTSRSTPATGGHRH